MPVIDRGEFFEKLDALGEEVVRGKLDLGLYGGRKLRFAEAWIMQKERDAEAIQRFEDRTRVIEKPQTVNIFLVVTKIKPIKWLLSKLGIKLLSDESQNRS